MGLILQAIEALIADYIRNSGMVLWFDPERYYEGIVRELNAGHEQLLIFDGSFYKLRLEAEPLLRGLDPPKLLVYLPVAWEQAREPLAEMLVLGVALRPGAPGDRNSRLAVIARKALKGRITDTRLADLDRQIEQGNLTITELEQLAAQSGGGPLPTALVVHFGTPLVDEAALEFLGGPERDSELLARNALDDWAQALEAQYGLTHETGTSPSSLRSLLTRQALICDLVESLGSDVPESLNNVISTKDPLLMRRSAELAKQWRNRRDLVDTYGAKSAEVARSTYLDSIDFSDAALERVHTFLSLEKCLLRRIATRVVTERNVVKIAQSRLRGFWSEYDTELQAEWGLVAQAGQLLDRAAEIEKALHERTRSWTDLIDCYIGVANWAELDTLHRRLERRASSLEFALSTPPEEVEQLILTVRHRHQEVSGALAEQFIRAWGAEGFTVHDRVRQTEVYSRYVAPEIGLHRIAYVLVDALRWELARELPEVLGNDFEIRIESIIGIAPSITEVGMAALLPLASSGLNVDGDTTLHVSLHGQVLRSRADRIAYLKERAGVPVLDLKLEDPKGFRRKLREIATPALIVVTSCEIDQSGEDEMTAAREHMERVLTYLGLAIRKLADEGIERFVITADHGYLFGEDLAESDKIDPPGGKTLLFHRRVWVGRGGSASERYLLTEVSRFGAGSDLEMAVPWNLAGFRTAGPTAYFHGGLSPQEILLPVAVVSPKIAAASKRAQKLSWQVSLGSAKVTTRFLSVRIQASSQGLFAASWPSVRAEVRAGGEVCSIPVSGLYGFQETTGALWLRSLEGQPTATELNSVTLMLTGKAPSRGTVSIHIVDAATGVELHKLENVEVSLAI